MRPCRSVLPLLEPFVDGELEPDKVLEVEQHLVDCELCNERVRLNHALQVSTRRAVHAALAPSDALRSRIQAALHAETDRQRSVMMERERSKPLPWRTIVPVAAAAAFTLVFASTNEHAPSRERVEEASSDTMSMKGVEQLIEEFVNRHARASEPPQVTEPSLLPNLEPEVGVPVQLPSLQQYDARWEGASVVPLRNQRAASLRYRVGGHRVTLYVYDSKRFPLRAVFEPRVVRDRPIYVGTRHGYSIAAREERGVGHAVATDLNDRESAELVASIY